MTAFLHNVSDSAVNPLLHADALTWGSCETRRDRQECRVRGGCMSGVVPGHDIVGYGRGRDACGRVHLHALYYGLAQLFAKFLCVRYLAYSDTAPEAYLEVPHQAAAGGGRHVCVEERGWLLFTPISVRDLSKFELEM